MFLQQFVRNAIRQSKFYNTDWASATKYTYSLSPPLITVRIILGYAHSKFTSVVQFANYSSSPDANNTNDEPVKIPNPFQKEQRQCILCSMGITPNYKNVRLLSQFQSPHTGRIYGRHITGLCKSKQEHVEKEIVKAQSAGFMAVYLKSPEFLSDSRLFDPERPIRPHKY